MADGEINIKSKIDNSEVDKGVKDLKTKLGNVGSPSTLKNIAKLGGAFAAVTSAVKLTTQAVKETTAAYNVQKKAEVQLEQAARNNPYLDSQSVKALKNYASELQKISAVGDEEILPFMSQLASAGRTQDEIQKIMSAALDVSASGMMSLDSAVASLNATFSGNVGTMGRQISELKNLTKEELASGKAIDIVANKFKGMAKEVKDATGASQELKNAWGDLKEEIGAGLDKAIAPVRRFFSELVGGWADAKRAKREYDEAVLLNVSGNGNISSFDTQIKEEKKLLTTAEANYKRLKTLKEDAAENKSNSQNYKKWRQAQGDLYTTDNSYDAYLLEINAEYDAASRAFYSKRAQVAKLETERDKQKAAQKLAAEKEAAEKEAALKKAQKEQDEKLAKEAAAERNAEAADFIRRNREDLQRQLKELELRAELEGKEIDQQEKLNILQESYISLVTGSRYVTEANSAAVERMKMIENFIASMHEAGELIKVDISEIKRAAEEYIGTDSTKTPLSETMQTTIDALTMEREILKDNADAWEEYTSKIEELEKLKTKVIKKEQEETAAATKQKMTEITAELNSYLTEFSSIVSQVTDMVRQNNEANNNQALAALDEEYANGILSYEEYCAKKEELSRKAAYDEYKINMWTWTASLLQATANVAEGVSKAIAQGGTAGIITGALVAAAGAANIAAITASKPTPPTFATGGIVGGNSYTGDHVNARLNSGEMVLNAAQQAQLWKTANGTGGGGVSLKVAINNNASNDVKASAQLTSDGLRVTIDKLVGSSIEQGRYNNALDIADKKKTGVSYL